MKAKSSHAKHRYVPGSSRGGLSLVSFQRQMAEVARGDQIKALRARKARESDSGKFTQQDVADALDVTLRAVQDWEASSEDNPKGIKWPHAKRLAKLLDADPEDVARREDESEPGPWSGELAQLREQLQRIEDTQAVILETIALLSVDPDTVAPSGEPVEKQSGRKARTASA